MGAGFPGLNNYSSQRGVSASNFFGKALVNIQKGESMNSDGTKKTKVQRVIGTINMAKQKLQQFSKNVERVAIPKVYMRLYLNKDYRRKGREDGSDASPHIRNES